MPNLTDEDVFGTPPAEKPASASEAQLRPKVTGDIGGDPAAARSEIAASQASLSKVDPASRDLLQGHITEMQRQLGNIAKLTGVPAAQPTSGGTLTDAEVFGGAPAPLKRQPRSDFSIAAGGVGAGTKALSRAVADFGDMFLAIPGMLMGSAADVASRVQSLVEGTDSRAAGRIAKEVRQGITSDFSPAIFRKLTETVIGAIAPDKKELDPTDVQKGMEIITQGLDKGGQWVEKKTGGVITAETFDSLVNEGMALGGLKGATGVARFVTPKEKAPTIKPQQVEPDTPAAEAAKRDVKADIFDSTGMTQTAEALRNRGARREQARAAFAEDPQYADYLKNYAEEEARQRTVGQPLTAPGGLEGSGPRAKRTGSTGAVEEPSGHPSTPPLETSTPAALDSALSKIRAGQSFDLTAEERIAMRDVASQYGRPDIQVETSSARPQSRPHRFTSEEASEIAYKAAAARKAKKQGGTATPEFTRLVAALGLGTALTAYAYQHQENFPETLAVAAGSIFADHGARSTLGAAMRDSGYTIKTLERLPQNRTVFTREQVLEQLKRPDVTAAEKKVVEGILWRKQPTISARELADGFRNWKDRLRLMPQETNEYADYGLNEIGRFWKRDPGSLDELQRDPGERAAAEEYRKAHAVDARTTVYQSPVELGDKNHFSDPNYFAHTRSFDEGGIRHVVEIQSDVAQHAKVLTPQERFEAKKAVQEAERAEAVAQREYRVAAEHVTKLALHDDGSPSMLAQRQTAGVRRSETSRALNNAILRANEAKAALGSENLPDVEPMLKHWYKRIVREELAQTPGEPVRFATADTVAKVEGWDDQHAMLKDNIRETKREIEGLQKRVEANKDHRNTQDSIKSYIAGKEAAVARMEEALNNPRFSLEHQPIYDRYKGEIEKFLRNDLNAKPYTDEKGHTWLEVPPQPKGPTRMFGRTDVESVAALAAFVGGALAMQAYSDNPSIIKDVVAGLVASAATRVRPRTVAELIRSASNARPRESIAAAAVERDGNLRLAGLDTINMVRKVAKLVPDEAARERVQAAIKAASPKGLSEPERAAYSLLRDGYAKLDGAGLDPKALAKAVEDLPDVKDAALAYSSYASAIAAAAENGRLLATIKNEKTASGEPLIQKAKDAPPGYQAVDHPQLRGLQVHPEIAPQLRFIFDNAQASGIGSMLEIVADVSKRSAVSASAFHVKALIDVLVAAVPGKAKYFGGAALGAGLAYGAATALGDEHAGREAVLGGIAGFVGPRMKAYATGRNSFVKEMFEGSNSAFITRAVKSGLMFGAEKGPLVVDDAGRRFYDAMALVQKVADKIASPVGIKAGKPVELYVKANHWMDTIMWGRLHPAMKLEVWSKTSDILRESSIKRNAADPKARVLSRAEADSLASNYTNDLFGGLNWTKIAMEAKTVIGQKVAQELLSSKGRRFMRIAMFAPDWTISTARSALAAIDKDLINPLKWGSVAKGMFQPITRGDLARQYVARSALYYLIAGDAINYSMSGHHIWENDKKVGWSFIDWGDGRRMQFSKHIMETPHWVDHPVRQGLSKLGYVPKEIANQALGVEYLYPRPNKYGGVSIGPSMTDPSAMGRVEHALKGFTPIAFQTPSIEAGAWGSAGMPLFGYTKKELEERNRARAEAKRRGK